MFNRINIIPRWIIFCIDIVMSIFALLISFLIKYDFNQTIIEHNNLVTSCIIITVLSSLIFLLLRTYAGIIRLTTIQDTLRILSAVLFVNAGFFVINLFSITYNSYNIIPATVLILNTFVGFVMLIVYRIGIKHTFAYFKNLNIDSKKVIIYGASEAGLLTKRTIEQDDKAHYKVVAFIDDDYYKVKKNIDSIKIFHSSKLSQIAKSETIDELIITVTNLTTDKKNSIVDICLDSGIRVLHIPPVEAWINGQLSSRQIQKVKIEELLEREPIRIHNEIIQNQLKNKRILVTGAAGSIGSEIVRQLAKFNPAVIILVDTAETALYESELTLNEDFSKDIFKYFIADIRNYNRMEYIFKECKPHYVYHAAAYKHVPMMELHPSEAIGTNIIGTKNLADLSVKFNVQKFVMVSTDKAVNPTNVMGATKRIAEIYVQSLGKEDNSQNIKNTRKTINPIEQSKSTKFITTRFGNVLGSNGSVIPRFTTQINNGGPVTITHPDICRYFMTIPEACQLVLEAGTMGQGGEIFVFNMGKLVKIVDMAKKMIRLSGLTPGVDIDIKYTGLRPGEKLHEELLNTEENTIPTYHDQILIANIREADKNILEKIDHLIEAFNLMHEEIELVRLMKAIVPEFISNNSIYEEIDKPAKSNIISIKSAVN
ncbi:MAG: nucleoside-diphosphate sugar epimerase/dehydratase [Sphingobacteriia bacterium]